ncbi:MAG TPA: DUF262 domain-containing protein [Pyrinomonadaceae bacterium]|nr:DUF262 domain-containing protein [Pyrinomonadaceae bacterium]HMP65992.1 DUF262 domain-containing protein [Pyrinomonadaceae bacterium]
MAFQTPITIKEAVDNIRRRKYLLPSIQRKLVWNSGQIERLFDSLMRDYPIGSFLFWHVDRERLNDFTFYEFIKDYHERDNRNNAKADPISDSDITGILDGQQRLTSLYIGLFGSYAEKEKSKRWDNDKAFPKRFLHLNLLKGYTEDENDLELAYDFYFMTEEEARENRTDDPENFFWFRASDIFTFKSHGDIGSFLMREISQTADPEKAQFANDTLFKFYSLVNDRPVINFFLEKNGDLDKVLNIFVRVNSGGTQLSYADLLLSIASASWNKLDAREEITNFVEEISDQGTGFRFSQDFVLKSALVLSDLPNIQFKVNNFNNANMRTIEENWGTMCDAIRLAVNLVESFGYTRETLSSNYALIPIAYYLLKKGNPPNFVESANFLSDRQNIRKWLIASLLKRAFGGQPDTVLRPIRQILQRDSGAFPIDAIVDEFKGKNKSIVFTDDDISALFDHYYGSQYTFSTLAVFYPTLDFKNKFHVDHIFPKSLFKRKNLLNRGISEPDADVFMENVDYLANLQLLEGIPNMEKSNKEFKDWLEEAYPDKDARRAYMERNYIPDVDLSLENFGEFFEERTKLMTSRFAQLIK